MDQAAAEQQVRELEALRAKTYRAIGRYTVQFSLLVFAMRRIWSGYLAKEDEQSRDLLEVSFGSLGASAIADSFFAVCQAVADLDEDEQAICSKLRKGVSEEIGERNNLLHGDWLIGFWTSDTGPIQRLVRMKASRQTTPVDERTVNPDELNEIATRVERLAGVVWQFGLACTQLGESGTRVRDAIRLADDGQLVQPDGTVWIMPNPHGP